MDLQLHHPFWERTPMQTTSLIRRLQALRKNGHGIKTPFWFCTIKGGATSAPVSNPLQNMFTPQGKTPLNLSFYLWKQFHLNLFIYMKCYQAQGGFGVASNPSMMNPAMMGGNFNPLLQVGNINMKLNIKSYVNFFFLYRQTYSLVLYSPQLDQLMECKHQLARKTNSDIGS